MNWCHRELELQLFLASLCFQIDLEVEIKSDLDGLSLKTFNIEDQSENIRNDSFLNIDLK